MTARESPTAPAALVQSSYVDPRDYRYTTGDPWNPAPWDTPRPSWTPLPSPPIVTTTVTTSTQSAQSDREKRLIKTVHLLLDLLVEIEFDGVRPHDAAEWETQQAFRNELIGRTFVVPEDLLILSE